MEPHASNDALIGRTLGEFVLTAKLGEGGFGAVYRAEQTGLQREAVVKVLQARHRGAQDVTQRFLREAKLASKLDHPFAAHIYAFGAEPDGVLWIAMELVRGTPLDTLLLQKGPLPLEQFAALLDRLGEVLATAHEQGIVHRDIKPANVMVLARAGRLLPKLLDLGVAKAVDDSFPDEDTLAPGEAPTVETLLDPADPHLAETAQAGLTQDGALIGSPPYMAPEQWSGATVGARTDLYALGALAYEAITGRRAFDAPTLLATARAHAATTRPTLGEGFPPELDAVLRRAMALRPEDRFGSALELAAAFRAAAGLTDDRVALPQLDRALRDRLIAEAPQPLAEALAQQQAARNVHQAWDALWQVFEVVVRALALIAVASRAQTRRPGDTPAVDEKLRILHKRKLADEEWLDLARALAQLEEERRDAYPVPELLGLLLDGDVVTAGWSGDPFEPLLALRDARRARGSELEVRQQLERALPALERLLYATSWLCDYPLVVPRGGGVAERWMGLRPPRRRASPIVGGHVVGGRPLLTNADGAPVLLLWPLVQVGEPVVGAPEELFLFDGRGRNGAKLVALPTGFERVDDEVWGWFRSALLEIGGEAGPGGADDERAPYRGLAVFSPDDAGTFFGREREVEEALNKLKLQPLLAVVGPSGAGKSSFVQAGLIPALPEGWRAITVRPGPSPMAALAARLHKERPGAAETRADPTPLAADLAGLAEGGVLVLVVDQLEELFTLCSDETERARFAALLMSAARTVEEPVRVVLTLRDDFLVRAEQEPALKSQLSRALQILSTPALPDLVRIVVEPARRAGYEFDDPALPDEMARAVAERASALPLLSFTAARLWEARDRQFKQLTRRAYTTMGRVSGALARHADEVLHALPADEQRLVREAFRHLVTAEGTRAVLERRELVELLGGASSAIDVVEKLIAARLLQIREAEGGLDRVEVVHEALLVAWPRLVEWRREDAEGSRLRDALRAAVRQWDERGRPAGLLWRGDALAEVRAWRARHGAALTTSEAAFLDASLADEQRGRRVRQGLLASSFVLLVAVAVALGALGQRARQAARDAHARLLQNAEEQGRQAWLDGHPGRALPLLVEAAAGGRDTPALRYLLSRAAAAFEPLRATFTDGGAPVGSAQLLGGGTRLLTASSDGLARLWDVAGARTLVTLRHPEGLSRAVATPDDKYVLTSGRGVTRVWDLDGGRELVKLGSDAVPTPPAKLLPRARFVTGGAGGAVIRDLPAGREVRTLTGHTAPLDHLEVSGDGTTIVTVGVGETARAWDADSGAPRGTLALPTRCKLAAVSHDGARVALLGMDGRVQVWTPRGGGTVWMATGSEEALGVDLSPDGTLVAVGGPNRRVEIFDAQTGRLITHVIGGGGGVREVQFHSDGRRLVGVAPDGVVRVWEARSGRLLASLFGHRGPAHLDRFDGEVLATASEDGTARIWELARAGQGVLLDGGAGLTRAVFSRDGAQLYAAGDAGVRVWDAVAARPIGSPPLPPGLPTANQQLARDGAVAAWGEGSREVVLTGPRLGAPLRTLAGHRGPIEAASFSSDGAQLLTTSESDGTARVWDVASGQLRRELHLDASWLTSGAFSPRGDRIATATQGGDIQLWDAATGTVVRTLRGHRGFVLALAFSPDGTQLLSGSGDQKAIVWDLATGRARVVLDGHSGGVVSVAFRADGALLATGSVDRTARLWDSSGKLVEVVEQPQRVWMVDFAPRGTALATASEDGTVLLRDTAAAARAPAELARELRCRLFWSVDQGLGAGAAQPDCSP